MKRKERQQKLHDSLINMLYASPSPSSHQPEFDNQTLNFAREIVTSDSHRINTDELEEEEDERSSGEGELGVQKLTRAQRKRLRKKKLKEAASQRRQIIGPQLPPAPTGGDHIDRDVRENEHPQDIRRNATEKP